MGNILPLDAAKKEQIEEIAQDFLGTFTTEYVLAYGIEFARIKLKQIDEETYGEAERKKELMYRKKPELTDPHKEGFLTKKGAIVKNWKRRYFVVDPDYTIRYYENEDAYLKESKPKGVIHLAGYKVEESVEQAQLEKLKALVKLLGLSEDDIPSPEKYPDHTLELMHERRRSYYITAADEEEKTDWVEMFQLCCEKSSGFTNKDPVSQAAFKTAYYRACQVSAWHKRYGDCGGTEEQLLTETIAEIINYRVLSSTYSSLTGNFMIKRKLKDQVMKTLDSLILALVTPSYKGMVETTQSMKVPLEKSIDEKKGEIVEVQKKITEQLSDKLESIVTKAVGEATADIKKMFDDVKEVARKSQAEMRKECVIGLIEKLISETKSSEDVDDTMKKHFRGFDKVVNSLTSWRYWYKVYRIEQDYMSAITKYESTFDQRGDYSSVYLSHDMLSQVTDGAFFTFEETFKDRSKDTDIFRDNKKSAELMDTIKDDVLPKYDHDSQPTPDDIAFKITTNVVVECVTNKIDPLTKDIRKSVGSLIPEPLSKIVSVQDRYELYIEECVKDLIRKAIGLAKPKETKKEVEETEEVKKNGENDEMGNEQDEKKVVEKVEESEGEKEMERKDEGAGEEGKEENVQDLDKSEVNGEETKDKAQKETKMENGEMKSEETEVKDGNKEENKMENGEMKSEETEVKDGNKENKMENTEDKVGNNNEVKDEKNEEEIETNNNGDKKEENETDENTVM